MIDLGRLTEDQTADLVMDGLCLLPTERAYALIREWVGDADSDTNQELVEHLTAEDDE